MGAGSADAIGELFVGGAEVLQQLLICRRFFKRVQLAAVEVFKQSVAQKIVVTRVSDDRWDGLDRKSTRRHSCLG